MFLKRPHDPNTFVRTTLLTNEIYDHIKKGISIKIFGSPKFGKTYLMKELFQRGNSGGDWSNWLNCIYLEQPYTIANTKRMITEKLHGHGIDDVKIDADWLPDLCRYSAGLIKKAKGKNTKTLFILDDFDKSFKNDSNETILDWNTIVGLRSIAQDYGNNICFVFVYNHPIEYCLNQDWYLNVCPTVEIEYLIEDEAKQIVTLCREQAGLSINSETEKFIEYWAGRHAEWLDRAATVNYNSEKERRNFEEWIERRYSESIHYIEDKKGQQEWEKGTLKELLDIANGRYSGRPTPFARCYCYEETDTSQWKVVSKGFENHLIRQFDIHKENLSPKTCNDGEEIFSWFHISDIHFGHGRDEDKWDQKMVMDKVLEDIRESIGIDAPIPQMVFITGDIAFSGGEKDIHEYQKMKDWIKRLTDYLNISDDDIHMVPGNRDIQRSVYHENRDIGRLVEGIRGGKTLVDEAFADDGDLDKLQRRLENYIEFSSKYNGKHKKKRGLYWTKYLKKSGVTLKVIGLNTVLACQDEQDKGRLALGKEQLAESLKDDDFESDIVVVLSHHPFSWLYDGEETEKWVKSDAQIHLFGHMHEPDIEKIEKGYGTQNISIKAGAVHSPDVGTRLHGYNYASILKKRNGKMFLRIWPRKWSDKKKTFQVDQDEVKKGLSFCEYEIQTKK